MSKIICDVCGTSYPDSATQCPICGCASPVDAVESQHSDIKRDRATGYTYVKGGRFSKANVQKRNQGTPYNKPLPDTTTKTDGTPVGSKSDKGFVIAVCTLLLAVIAVAVYIVIHFLAATDNTLPTSTNPIITSSVQETEETTLDTTSVSIACTDLVLTQTRVTLTSVGESLSLGVFFTPADTTDQLQFISGDVTVATVSDTGEIVAVGPGETMVTVTCGDVSKQCIVICQFDNEIPEDTESSDVVGTEFTGPFKINKTDVSISVGETFQLKLTDSNGNIVPVAWSATIADICNVDGNYITGAEKGRTELSATYNGETFTCIVRVR